MLENLKNCILAARPKTLPAAITPVWAGCALCLLYKAEIDWLLAICTLISATCIQIATNFFNDVIDAKKGADTQERLGPTRVTASNLLEPRTVTLLGCIFLLIALFCGIVLCSAAGWTVIAIGIPSFYFSYGYTGGPYPLAYKGLGELFVLLFFGLIAVAGTCFIQLGYWLPESFIIGTQIGCLSAVLISINNLRDVEEDSKNNKNTLAVLLGIKPAKAIIVLEVSITFACCYAWYNLGFTKLSLCLLTVLLFYLPLLFALLATPPSKSYNKLLALSGVGLILFATAFHFGVQLTTNF